MRPIDPKLGITDGDGRVIGRMDYKRGITKEEYAAELMKESKKRSTTKDVNPKDAVSERKVPMSVCSAPVVMEEALAMMYGAREYGRHNYRVKSVRASVYYDACMRHLMAWWEGEDLDPDSGLHHLAHVRAGLGVIRDATMQGSWVDDRPPTSPPGWVERMNEAAGHIIDACPDAKEPFTEKDKF